MATKLVIRFHRGCALDAEAVHAHVSGFYDIAYTGVYDCLDYKAVYIQSSRKIIRMAPGKMKKKCQHFGEIDHVQKYTRREGTLIDEVGSFRRAGRKSTVKRLNETDTVATRTDSSVTNSINLHIHPFGEEDVSRITVGQFKEIIGDRDNVIQSTKDSLPDHEKLAGDAWESLRCRQRHRYNKEAYRKERLELCRQVPDWESDSESDEGEGITIGGEPVRYEADSDSEYNDELKKKVGTLSLLKESARHRMYDLPREMAGLVYDNPHNSNIVASTKDPNPVIFDGHSWTKKVAGHVDHIIENWKLKTREALDMLKRTAGGELSESFEGRYATSLLSLLDDDEGPATHAEREITRRHVKKRALVSLENLSARLKSVEARSGKRVRRVSGKERGLKGGGVERKTSWDELMSM